MATLVAWVPESTWPLPLAELIGRPNGRKTARNGAKMAALEGICYVGKNGVTPLSLKC